MLANDDEEGGFANGLLESKYFPIFIFGLFIYYIIQVISYITSNIIRRKKRVTLDYDE